jgi:hypothetical protein
MEEAPENSKESSHSAHANGMNEIDNCLSTEMAGHARRHKSTAIPL